MIYLQTSQADSLARGVVRGDLHVQGGAAVAKVLGGEDGTLLADEEGGLFHY